MTSEDPLEIRARIKKHYQKTAVEQLFLVAHQPSIKNQQAPDATPGVMPGVSHPRKSTRKSMFYNKKGHIVKQA